MRHLVVEDHRARLVDAGLRKLDALLAQAVVREHAAARFLAGHDVRGLVASQLVQQADRRFDLSRVPRAEDVLQRLDGFSPRLLRHDHAKRVDTRLNGVGPLEDVGIGCDATLLSNRCPRTALEPVQQVGEFEHLDAGRGLVAAQLRNDVHVLGGQVDRDVGRFSEGQRLGLGNLGIHLLGCRAVEDVPKLARIAGMHRVRRGVTHFPVFGLGCAKQIVNRSAALRLRGGHHAGRAI